MIVRCEFGKTLQDPITVIEVGQPWLDAVAGASGRARLRMIEPTLYGYLACRMQRARLMRPMVRATMLEELGLRDTLKALAEIGWDHATRIELLNSIEDGWEERINDRQANTLRRRIERSLLGAIRSKTSGEAGPSSVLEGELNEGAWS